MIKTSQNISLRTSNQNSTRGYTDDPRAQPNFGKVGGYQYELSPSEQQISNKY